MSEAAYHEIIDYLYIGSARALESSDRFSMIVNCTPDIPFPKNCANCIRIPVHDDPAECAKLISLVDSTQVLAKMHESILEKKPVLVHCFAGQQRSCAIVALYLILYYHMTPYQAIAHIKRKRRIAFFGHVNFAAAFVYFYARTGGKIL
jgi:hypothetical protein